MADKRFFRNRGPYKLAEIARMGQAKIYGDADPNSLHTDIGPIGEAGRDHVSFLDNKRYIAAFAESNAGAVVVAPQYIDKAPAGMALLVSDKPYRSFALIAHAFYEEIGAAPKVDASAIIDPGAIIGDGCKIDAYVVIGPGVKIGNNVHLGAHTVVGRGVTVGDECRVGAHVTLEFCDIGPRTQLHPGVRIGQRGFGFDMDAQGFIDVPQLGQVIVGADVEIGANTTVDRGAGPDTIIGDGCKIDNLVQVAHNVVLGKRCVLVAQSGIAGSSRLQDNVVIAAQVGVSGHLVLGERAHIGAQAGVMRDVPAGAKLVGSPAIPIREFFRMVSETQKLGRGRKKVTGSDC